MAIDEQAREHRTRRIAFCFGCVFVLLTSVLLSRLDGQLDDKAEGQRDEDDRFRPVRLLRPQPTITEFATISAAEADERMNAAELVIGVTVGKESRAYPINMLTGPSREILNDTLGGRPIAATW